MSERFRARLPDVIGEVIDGEAVVVDVRQGHYYSSDGLGASVWAELSGGRALAEVVDAVTRGGHLHEDAAASVQAFLDELLDNALLEPVEEPVPAPAADLAPLTGVLPLVLVRHTDMEELIQIDPVHDVDAAGWPAAVKR